MRLLSRFRRWLSGLFGGSAEPDTEATTDAETEPGEYGASGAVDAEYRCSVCNTPVYDPEEACSLCGASDPVPTNEPAETEDVDAGLDPTATREGVGAAPDDEVARLRSIRARETLDDHPDRWERVDGDRFRVHLADEDRVVDSPSAAAKLIRSDE